RGAIPVMIKTLNQELPIQSRIVRPAATSAAPVATDGNGKGPAELLISQPAPVPAAAGALGRLGPVAEESLPSLKNLPKPGGIDRSALPQMRMETEKQWQNRIQAIINKIEGK